MIPEAPLEQTDTGLVPTNHGWFVINAREARWHDSEGRAARLPFDGTEEFFTQVRVSLYVLEPGEPIGMYHWEADQEDFLVLAGGALLIIEGEERPLRQWDFVHCPPDTNHMIVGGAGGRSVVLAIGAREHQEGKGWGGYKVDETAQRHGVGVERETVHAGDAYARFRDREPARYREGWLPES